MEKGAKWQLSRCVLPCRVRLLVLSPRHPTCPDCRSMLARSLNRTYILGPEEFMAAESEEMPAAAPIMRATITEVRRRRQQRRRAKRASAAWDLAGECRGKQRARRRAEAWRARHSYSFVATDSEVC